MKKLFLTVLTTVLSFNLLAAPTGVKLVALDQTAETQVCLEAANNGLRSAMKKSVNLGINYDGFEYVTMCNDQPLVSFARKFKKPSIETVKETKTFKFVAANMARESQICAEAVTNGVDSVTEQHGNVENIICNGKSIVRFVKSYKS